MRESYGEAEDKRHFRFYYDDQQGKSITMNVSTSDGALGIVKEFEKFLKACGYIADGSLTIQRPNPTKLEEQKRKDFDFSAIPNNNWLFGSQPIPALTTADLSSITVTDLSTLTTQSWSNWATPKVNQYPTMAPLTTQQIQSWTTEMPGTLGGAKYNWSQYEGR